MEKEDLISSLKIIIKENKKRTESLNDDINYYTDLIKLNKEHNRLTHNEEKELMVFQIKKEDSLEQLDEIYEILDSYDINVQELLDY